MLVVNSASSISSFRDLLYDSNSVSISYHKAVGGIHGFMGIDADYHNLNSSPINSYIHVRLKTLSI